MKGFFETLFIAAALAFIGWGTINVGMKFEVKIKGESYGFTVGGMSEKARGSLMYRSFMNIEKDSTVYISGLFERADSAFMVEKFFPSLKLHYDTVRVYRLKPNTAYWVTGGIFLVYYQGLNFEPHQSCFKYYETIDEDSLFYRRMELAQKGD